MIQHPSEQDQHPSKQDMMLLDRKYYDPDSVSEDEEFLVLLTELELDVTGRNEEHPVDVLRGPGNTDPVWRTKILEFTSAIRCALAEGNALRVAFLADEFCSYRWGYYYGDAIKKEKNRKSGSQSKLTHEQDMECLRLYREYQKEGVKGESGPMKLIGKKLGVDWRTIKKAIKRAQSERKITIGRR